MTVEAGYGSIGAVSRYKSRIKNLVMVILMSVCKGQGKTVQRPVENDSHTHLYIHTASCRSLIVALCAAEV